ncbi:MAG: ribosome biogenesis GTPase Der [Nitrospinae bacterium]|nr:ribosome biogenesis GTPase Der [Nitrospinota bacterium]
MYCIAIVGRPNVGKSTLFNRIVGGRPAIVDDTPGVTRDRNISRATWRGRSFLVIDSGGFEPEAEDEIMAQIREQAIVAIEEADTIFLVVDAMAGITPVDADVAMRLRSSGKPVTVVVNKADDPGKNIYAHEFSRMGFERIRPVSAEHNLGVEDLLREALADVPPDPEVTGEEPVDNVIRLAVAGKPNVGKSSLINRLLGSRRMMVSDVPGTTRDAIDSEFEADGRKWVIIDTAGIRRKAKVTMKLEKYSVIMAMKAIERADVALLVVDGQEGAAMQEAKIAGLVEDAGKACVIVVNKWDVVEKDHKTAIQAEEALRRQLKFLAYAPALFVSAKSGQRVTKILKKAEEVYTQYTKRLPTSKLNEIVRRAVEQKEPPVASGKRLKIYFATQPTVKPPTFVLMTNMPDDVHFSYQRYLINRIREEGGFDLSPIRILFRRPSGRRTGEQR